jgi:hypothetical protein
LSEHAQRKTLNGALTWPHTPRPPTPARSHGYNSGYANGHGKEISNPSGYFKAVSQDRYGYNGVSKK